MQEHWVILWPWPPSLTTASLLTSLRRIRTSLQKALKRHRSDTRKNKLHASVRADMPGACYLMRRSCVVMRHATLRASKWGRKVRKTGSSNTANIHYGSINSQRSLFRTFAVSFLSTAEGRLRTEIERHSLSRQYRDAFRPAWHASPL